MSLKTETRIVPLVLFVAAAILSPPDVVSQVTLAVPIIIIYFLLRLIVSRFKSFAQIPQNIIILSATET